MSKSLRTRTSNGLFTVLSQGDSSRPRKPVSGELLDEHSTWHRSQTQQVKGQAGQSLVGNDLDHFEHEFEDLSRVTSQQSHQGQGSPEESYCEAQGFGSSPADDSPYPEVRAAVSAYDDIDLSINTPRMWSLSMLFAILGSATNMFFSLRYPSVTITPVIALLLVHPLGLLWDQLLQRTTDTKETFVNGTLKAIEGSSQARTWTSWRRWLAQGRWNEKEHACVYISSNVAFGFAFATDVIVFDPFRRPRLIKAGHR
jgi:hypothetical protein